MKWLREHPLFSVIGGIVLALCLVIVVSFLTAGGSTFIGHGVHGGVSVLEKPIAALTGGVRNTVTGVFKYNDLKNENEKLKEQVESLEEQNKDLRLTKDEKKQLEELAKSFDFEPYESREKAVAARVIEIDNSNPYVVFSVDAGSKKGIEKNDIVVDGDGLIGRVTDVGKKWAKIVSVLSENNSISFKVLRRTSVMGVVSGNGKNKLEGYVMNENDRIIKGDKLVTSGIGVYPEGIVIGRVSAVEYDEDRGLKVVTVKPTVDFDSLQKVAIY